MFCKSLTGEQEIDDPELLAQIDEYRKVWNQVDTLEKQLAELKLQLRNQHETRGAKTLKTSHGICQLRERTSETIEIEPKEKERLERQRRIMERKLLRLGKARTITRRSAYVVVSKE
jgi:hypothetical protein